MKEWQSDSTIRISREDMQMIDAVCKRFHIKKKDLIGLMAKILASNINNIRENKVQNILNQIVNQISDENKRNKKDEGEYEYWW